MVKLASESGCVSVFVGMESLDEGVLEETNKPFNRVKKFAEEIKMFHDHGIMVNPGIVFGFDNDDESVFERAVKFLTKTQVEFAYFNVLTPLPGTALFDRYNAAGRIFDRDWAKYDGKHVVYHPSRMTPEQLQEGFYWANHQFYSLPSICSPSAGNEPTPRRPFGNEPGVPQIGQTIVSKGNVVAGCRCPQGSASQASELRYRAAHSQCAHRLEAEVRGNHSAGPGAVAEYQDEATQSVRGFVCGVGGDIRSSQRRRASDANQTGGEQAKIDIIVNFEHLKHATPKALETLLNNDSLKAVAPYAKIRYRKFTAAFASALEGFTLSGLEILQEDWQDA